MRRTFSWLVAVALSAVALPVLADESPATDTETKTAPVVNAGGAIAPTSELAQVHAGTSQSAASSGRAREVDVADKGGPKTARPAATPRALRKMNADRAMASVEPAIRACATESAASTFALRLSVAPNGDVESTELASGRAPAPVLACVTKAVAKMHFGTPGAAGASVVLPVTVPARTPAQ